MSRGRGAWRGSQSDAHIEARKLFGLMGVAVGGKTCKVGRFLKDPQFGSPPWPIEVWGEGETWREAVEMAQREFQS